MNIIDIFNQLEDRLSNLVDDRNVPPDPDNVTQSTVDLAVYDMAVELLNIVASLRNELLRQHMADIERALRDAAPPGAEPVLRFSNPAEHPSTRPPDKPRTPTLRVVKEDFDDDQQ